MKKYLIASAILAAIMTGCSKSDDDKVITPEKSDYVGTVTVEYQGSDFDSENINVNFEPSSDGNTANITIQKIKFVPQMPVTIDVTIPKVTLSSTSEKIYLSCDNVIPLAMGGEYERYPVTNLTGEIEGNELSFSLYFGGVPTRFEGTLVQ